MKFPVKTCMGCGLDLTTAEPVKIKGPGEAPGVGLCPQCSAPYFLVEDSASVIDIPVAGPVAEQEAAAVEPEPPRARSGRRRASEPEPETPSESAEPETPSE